MGYDNIHAFAFNGLFLCEYFASQLSLVMGFTFCILKKIIPSRKTGTSPSVISSCRDGFCAQTALRSLLAIWGP
jgi:hypothetical protein